MPLDLNKCHSDCFNCIKKYKKKHDLIKGQNFVIQCRGIPKLYTQEGVSGLDNQTVKNIMDPVAWAAATLDWHCLDPDGEVWKRKNPLEYEEWREANPDKDILGHSRYHRPYQAEALRCSAKRKVFRMGRQIGKCLVSGTLIQMADGTQKPVEEVQDGDLVVSITDNYKSVTNKAYRACNGIKPTYRITLMDGRSVEATGNHPFLSRKKIKRETTGNRRTIYHDEWIETDQLTTDDYLAVPSNIQVDIPDTYIPEYGMTVLGCLIADGNITDNNCRFSNGNKIILNAFKKGVENFGCSLKQYECDQSVYDFYVIGQGSGKRHPIKDWMRNLKLQGLDSHQKFIPDNIMSLDNKTIAYLLKAMFGCDGWASVSKDGCVEIGYSTVSKKLANQVIALLARFNIYASCTNKTVKLNGKKYFSKQLCISRKESIANFRNHIGILGKKEELEKVYQASQAKNSSPKTEAYEDNDITFIRVRNVEYIGKKMTWDLTVPKTHNFIANNIITHNTEVLVISILYNIFLQPGVADGDDFTVIIITPYQSQIDLIFTRIKQLIRNSPDAQNSIKRDVKAPIYTLELHNSSVVRGFTAGTKSGGNAEAVRGQHANMLIFDEADYLSRGDMDAAMSIITNYPNATLWMSSTPSGKRERFYDTCSSLRYKEYYYPSQANPLWNEALEADFREALTDLGYRHEILAEFGEQEEGVFQNVYVQAAKRDYAYGDYARSRGWTYTFGVDWNDTANGTTIAVLGFNPAENKFILVDRHVVSREGWTQTAAMMKITELNRVWQPISIYIDAGHGGTQWELLRSYGYEAMQDPAKGPTHPDSRLKDIVTKYDFGSKIETRDLFTKQKINKPAKPFLVESTVRRFEANDIVIPNSDIDLEAQLLGYIIDRVTESGRPIYKAANESAGDHTLDALMLSVIAFVMEVTPLGKPKYETGIVFSGKMGEKLEPLVGDGDTVVLSSNPRQNDKKRREKTKPDMDRTDMGQAENSILAHDKSLPANHVQGPSVQPWNWDGFLRDESKPQIKTLSQAERDAKKRFGLSPRRGSRPRRKNI